MDSINSITYSSPTSPTKKTLYSPPKRSPQKSPLTSPTKGSPNRSPRFVNLSTSPAFQERMQRLFTVKRSLSDLFPDAPQECENTTQHVTNKRKYKKSPSLVKNNLRINELLYPLQELGGGNDHLVFGFHSKKVIIPTIDGERQFDGAKIIFKMHRPDKQCYYKTKEQKKNDHFAFACLPAKFAYFGKAAPLVSLLLHANDWEDPTCLTNGVNIWERCEEIPTDNKAVMENFWTFGVEIIHMAIEYGLIHKQEFVSDFRPCNVMLRMGTTDEFIITDASIPKDSEWKRRLTIYIKEWCGFCNRSIGQMTKNWTMEQKLSLFDKENFYSNEDD